jgi:hypothetical protein
MLSLRTFRSRSLAFYIEHDVDSEMRDAVADVK